MRLGREVAETARVLHLGGTSTGAGFVARCLACLGDREPFDPRDEGGLAAVATMIERELAAEITGSERRFVETSCDENGPDGEVREFPVHSDRGADLLRLRDLFHRFLATRHAVLDRMAAHRALMAMMSG